MSNRFTIKTAPEIVEGPKEKTEITNLFIQESDTKWTSLIFSFFHWTLQFGYLCWIIECGRNHKSPPNKTSRQRRPQTEEESPADKRAKKTDVHNFKITRHTVQNQKNESNILKVSLFFLVNFLLVSKKGFVWNVEVLGLNFVETSS